MTTPLRCTRGHRLTRWEPLPTTCPHEHREYRCPMRYGNRRCGDVVVAPQLGPRCTEED